MNAYFYPRPAPAFQIWTQGNLYALNKHPLDFAARSMRSICVWDKRPNANPFVVFCRFRFSPFLPLYYNIRHPVSDDRNAKFAKFVTNHNHKSFNERPSRFSFARVRAAKTFPREANFRSGENFSPFRPVPRTGSLSSFLCEAESIALFTVASSYIREMSRKLDTSFSLPYVWSERIALSCELCYN